MSRNNKNQHIKQYEANPGSTWAWGITFYSPLTNVFALQTKNWGQKSNTDYDAPSLVNNGWPSFPPSLGNGKVTFIFFAILKHRSFQSRFYPWWQQSHLAQIEEKHSGILKQCHQIILGDIFPYLLLNFFTFLIPLIYDFLNKYWMRNMSA